MDEKLGIKFSFTEEMEQELDAILSVVQNSIEDDEQKAAILKYSSSKAVSVYLCSFTLSYQGYGCFCYL